MTQIIEIKGYKIEVDCLCPPIPYRGWDWEASVHNGDYDYDWDGEAWVFVGTDPVGHGATRDEAIADLMWQLEEKNN